MKRPPRSAACLLLLALPAPLAAQDPDAIGTRLLADPKVQRALAAVRENEPALIEEQIRLTQIPAPPFGEAQRAAAYRDVFASLGLENVRIDAAGNVIGERPGRSARPHLVMSAHLDTVFPEGTDLTLTREDGWLKAPGIADDGRGLAVLIGVIRGLDAGGVETAGRISFVGTVGEEGLGDLRGVKHLFAEELKDRIDRFVSVDGTGNDITGIAVGSHRYRVHFEGPGGHSYGAFGLVNPVHALGRGIARIADFQVPAEPKTTFSVGRIGGGTSINSIAFEAWMEVDLRSADPASLERVDAALHEALEAALDAENQRWPGGPRLGLRAERVGTRPAGRTPADSPLLRAAVSVTRALDLELTEVDEGSTDSNIAMSLGIPAVTVGGGGRGLGAHSLAERWNPSDSWQGTQRALLLAIALSEPLS